jgi:hypothetical protein
MDDIRRNMDFLASEPALPSDEEFLADLNPEGVKLMSMLNETAKNKYKKAHAEAMSGKALLGLELANTDTRSYVQRNADKQYITRFGQKIPNPLYNPKAAETPAETAARKAKVRHPALF